MLKDEPLDYIQEQYNDKNEILSAFGEQVNATTLYEDIYGDIYETQVPVVIIDDDLENQKHIRTMSVEDAIIMSECRNDVLLGGSTYFNNWISKRSAKDIHAFIIDYDNAYSGILLKALQDGWANPNGEQYAYPTYIVNSGTGLHLYFVFNEPIPNYKSATENLDKVYRALAIQQSRRVYVTPQVQWFGQDFRMGGGLNKYGWENTIFRVGELWDIDELAKAVGLTDIHFTRYGEKRTKKPNQEHKKSHNKKRVNGWKTNKAFYNYSLEHCRLNTKEGNRYLSMCALSCIAWKCGVDIETLENDLLNLLPTYNKDAKRIIKPKEIKSALKMYNDKAILTQRQSLEHWQGWKYEPKIQRNGLKREQHLTIARTIKQAKKTMGIMKQEGRPNKQLLVEQWQQSNPQGTITECAKQLKISRTTIYKYWNNNKG